MRLFLLPISSRRNLIYCQKLNKQLSQQAPTFVDKISTKATTTWLDWEKKEAGWQKKITTYGNKLFQRLPYEEYGLKSIPSLKERRKGIENAASGAVQVEFPSGWIEESRVQQTLQELGSDEKQAFHRKWLIGSLIGMPAVAPFALLPVVPNLPFFYLCFRAWSHWRARAGSIHLRFLLENKLFKLCPSTMLHFAYAEATMDRNLKQIKDGVKRLGVDTQIAAENTATNEYMLLSRSSGAIIAAYLEIPEIQMEIERAVWQVERAINAGQKSPGMEKNSSKEKSKKQDK